MQWATLWSMVLALLPLSTSKREEAEARERQREELLRLVQEHSRTLLAWSLRLAQAVLALSFLFATATIVYSLLYYLVIPSRLHEQDIFFDYGNHAALAKRGVNTFSLPTARLNLLDAEHQWVASSLVDVPAQAAHVLVPGVKYDVLIELQMPESSVNHEIGMFMVQTTLASHDNAFLASSQRAVIVRDSHPLVHWVRTAFWLVPYALRVSDPAQSMLVLAINGFTESKTHPLTSVSIVLNHPEVQIYSAKLTIIAQLSGVRYLMYHWSVPTAVLVILNLVFLEALGLLVLYAFYSMPPPTDEDGGLVMGKPATTVVDQGDLFERHRSGGIPPVHVERAIKTDDDEETKITTDTLLMEQIKEEQMEEERALRYRGDVASIKTEPLN